MLMALPVTIQTRVIRDHEKIIYYPVIYGLANQQVQNYMNQMIVRQVRWLMEHQYKEQNVSSFVEMIGTFEIKTNERHILSLTFSNYAYADQHAHGLTFMKSLTFDVRTGNVYQLPDLFKPSSDYIQVISNIIRKQIKLRDLPTINEFTSIASNQDFYLADKSLVVYFQLYDITPYYVGLPMFPISVYELGDVIEEDGPLGRLAAN